MQILSGKRTEESEHETNERCAVLEQHQKGGGIPNCGGLSDPRRTRRRSHHFQANGYGSTGIGKFIFSFTVQTFGEETRFTFGPGTPPGTLITPGSVGIHGSSRTFTLTATLAGLPADAEASTFLQQTSGAPWRWFQTAVRVPPPVLDPTISSA